MPLLISHHCSREMCVPAPTRRCRRRPPPRSSQGAPAAPLPCEGAARLIARSVGRTKGRRFAFYRFVAKRESVKPITVRHPSV